jgi:hypothetical protein
MRILLLALLVVVAPALRAQTLGDSVRLTLIAGPVVTGTLVERTREAWRLSQAAADAQVIPASDVLRGEMRVVRTRRALRSQSMWYGLIIGAVAGYAVYKVEVGSQSNDPGLAGLLVIPLVGSGAVVGGVAGYIVGSARQEIVWRQVPKLQ